ncbi:hypothetical protein ACJX0J_032225, partial [Zea mays]
SGLAKTIIAKIYVRDLALEPYGTQLKQSENWMISDIGSIAWVTIHAQSWQAVPKAQIRINSYARLEKAYSPIALMIANGLQLKEGERLVCLLKTGTFHQSQQDVFDRVEQFTHSLPQT